MGYNNRIYRTQWYIFIRATSSVHLHSVSGQTMFERSNVSMEREVGASDLRSKRTASAHGLNMSTDGRRNEILYHHMLT